MSIEMEKLKYEIGQIVTLIDKSKQRIIFDPDDLSTKHIGTVTQVSEDGSEIRVMWSPVIPGFLNRKEYEYGQRLSVKILNEHSDSIEIKH